MKFSEITIGQKAEIQHKITEQDIEKFVDLTGDDNRLHVDKEYARSTNFKKPVAHGMLGASFISTIIGTKLPGDGALWFSQNLEFLMPARVGDQITVKAEVIKKHERQRIIELTTDVFNQHKQKIISGTAKVKIVAQEEKEEDTIKEKTEKTALIIGASGGIGAAVAKKLAARGYNLALHYNTNKTSVSELEKQINAEYKIKVALLQADITNTAEVQELKNNFSRKFHNLTAIVNASTIKFANIEFSQLSWEDIQKHIEINIKGLFNLSQVFLPLLKESQNASIISLNTQATESTPPPQWLHYVTAKSALTGFTKSLAIEFAKHKIRVNSVSPGMTNTDLIADIPEKAKLLAKAQTPLQRIAEPEDVANSVCFLISEDAGFMTGQTLRVNGGINML